MAFQRELGQLSSVRRVRAKNPKTWSDYTQPYLKGNQSCSSVVIRTDVQRCPLEIVSLLSDGCHTLSSTHTTYHDYMEEKRAEACNQSWLRCYQPATGCLLLMDLDSRWCVMFSYMTTVIYDVCLRGEEGEGTGGEGARLKFPDGSLHTSIQVQPKSRPGDYLQVPRKTAQCF